MKKEIKELTLEDLQNIRGAAEAIEVDPDCLDEGLDAEGGFVKKGKNVWKRRRCQH